MNWLMMPTQNVERNREHPIRLWPGVVAVILQWLLWLVVPMLAPDAAMIGMLGGIAGGGLAVLIWWLFFSRVPWMERIGALALIAGAAFATRPILDKSIAGGMMGMMFPMLSIPVLSLALVAGAVVARSFTAGPRRVTLALAILAGFGFWAGVRTDGIMGEGKTQLAWRWTQTPEQKLLARADAEPAPPAKTETPAATPAVAAAAAPAPTVRTVALTSIKPVPHAPAIWPGFRGPNRDDVITGLRIKTDWAVQKPAELWRRPVGPAWSSFAVGDGLVYTQEQRGDFEVVSAYKEADGRPVWIHRDTARFYESNGGPGPRATPMVKDGRVYTLGATGILNALDADTGRVIWMRNAAADTHIKTPGWGFAGSPLVVDDVVIVATAGKLAAYDIASGSPRWTGPDGGGGYGSPHLLTIGGVPQVILLNGDGAISVTPTDGKVLWKHSWPGAGMLQPSRISDDSILITTGDMGGGAGTRRLTIAQGASGWTAQEVWTSTGLKPYFNDIVVHNGYAYGFDGGIISCIDLQDGKRKWKGGHYGHGQLLLVADSDLLLVVSEEGEIALVSAAPGEFKEVARVPAIEGKTWNHPVLADDVLLVRNGQEMVAFRLPRTGV